MKKLAGILILLAFLLIAGAVGLLEWFHSRNEKNLSDKMQSVRDAKLAKHVNETDDPGNNVNEKTQTNEPKKEGDPAS